MRDEHLIDKVREEFRSMTHTMKTPIKTRAIAANVGGENLRFSQIASIAHEHGMMQSFAICKSTLGALGMSDSQRQFCVSYVL